MAKTRGLELTRDDGKWTWFAHGQRWELRLEPYAKRKLLRNGVIILSQTGVTFRQIMCPDDAVLFSLGFEQAQHDEYKGDKPC